MRNITEIIIHCADTPEGKDFTVDQIRQWHTLAPPKGNGWSDIGYHWVIYRDGTIHAGRPEVRPCAHVRGHNAHSIGVCYVGGRGADGKAKDTRTPAQRVALRAIVAALLERYPSARVYGHHDFDKRKLGPCFDVPADL